MLYKFKSQFDQVLDATLLVKVNVTGLIKIYEFLLLLKNHLSRFGIGGISL